jgi:hypothetical protein
MTARLCPRCGGLQLRQIAPGVFECMSLIDISHPTPGGMMHGHIPCGHRFQLGSSSSVPCGAQQRADAAAQRQRERDAAAAKFEQTRQRIVDVLKLSNDSREVAEALASAVVAENDPPLVTVEECRDAWVRIVAAGLAGAPTHELTTAVGSKSWICLTMQWPVPAYDPGWLWRERDRDARVDLWGPLSRSSEMPEPVWLDGSGTAYRPDSDWDGGRLDACRWRSERPVVVGREARFRTRASGTGFGMRIRSARRSLVDGRVVTKVEPAASSYSAAVASVLGSGMAW